MPERVDRAGKKIGALFVGPRPVLGQEPSAEPAQDSAKIRRRPGTPEELLADIVRRAKEAEESARLAADQAAQDAQKVTGDVGKQIEGLAGKVADALEKATRPQPAQAAPEGPKPQPAEPKSFLGRLWDGAKSLPGKIWDGIKWAGGKAWDGIKWASDRVGLTKAIAWAAPKVQAGFLWFQQKLRWLIFGLKFEPFKTRKEVYDPGDVNFPNWDEIQKAKKEIPERAEAEKAAIAKLSSADQQRYQDLAKLTEKRPLSRWALQNMLLDGRLPGNRDLESSGSLLENLHRLARQDLAPGIRREDLVSDIVAEIENPVRINQQGKGTCVATTAQILLVRKHPAEYARIIADLARPRGTTRTAMGGKLDRVSDWADTSDGSRSVPSRLIQPALMNMGQFPDTLLDYSNTDDRSKLGPIGLGGGLMGWGSARINSQLQGRDYDSHMFFHWNRNSLWNKLEDALAQGKGPIPIGMQWEDLGGHQVQIDKIENGTVHYTNPWGLAETMDASEFKGYILNAEIPK